MLPLHLIWCAALKGHPMRDLASMEFTLVAIGIIAAIICILLYASPFPA
jgi:hypothetical protein